MVKWSYSETRWRDRSASAEPKKIRAALVIHGRASCQRRVERDDELGDALPVRTLRDWVWSGLVWSRPELMAGSLSPGWTAIGVSSLRRNARVWGAGDPGETANA